MTIECENKNKICYYFPINYDELIENMEIIKNGYNKNILPVNLLWQIMDKKKNEE
jgi:hypothetical protein